MSFEINNRLKYVITKQTNLISILMLTSINNYLAQMIIMYANNYLQFVFMWMYFLSVSTTLICIIFTFNWTDNYYQYYCKYTHSLCICLCKQSRRNYNDYRLMNNNINYGTNGRTELTICSSETCLSDNCETMHSFCKMLNQYDAYNHDDILENINLTDILNNFNHLLLCHDTDDDFNKIYDKLSYNHSYHTCKVYLRHYRRQTNSNGRYANIYHQHEKEEKMQENDRRNILSMNILDKIHSYYCHSYDTLLRNKASQKRNMQNILNLFRSKQNVTNINSSMNNKFSSNLKINSCSNDHNNKFFSFGERFEYDDDKKELYVSSKYNSFKDELINNEMENISIELYNSEYTKSVEYMHTDYVKTFKHITQQLTISHILSVLIYCNCDSYQRTWSQTYRFTVDQDKNILKQHHSHFYFSSKYLREFIEWFGIRLINNEKKKFYHGISEILYFTKTITQFNGPLSTSEEINVALNFSSNSGIVLAL
eukprot:241274_1